MMLKFFTFSSAIPFVDSTMSTVPSRKCSRNTSCRGAESFRDFTFPKAFAMQFLSTSRPQCWHWYPRLRTLPTFFLHIAHTPTRSVISKAWLQLCGEAKSTLCAVFRRLRNADTTSPACRDDMA